MFEQRAKRRQKANVILENMSYVDGTTFLDPVECAEFLLFKTYALAKPLGGEMNMYKTSIPSL